MVSDIKRAAGEVPSSGEPRRWDEWTAEELAALWPKHGIKPAQGRYFYMPTDEPQSWDACAVGILAVDVRGLPVTNGDDIADVLTDAGYPRAWLYGLIDGFDDSNRDDNPTVEYDMGYELGQRVAALVFEAVPQ